jgi:hypothetical protein
MRKLFAVTLVLLLTPLFFACGKTGNEKPESVDNFRYDRIGVFLYLDKFPETPTADNFPEFAFSRIQWVAGDFFAFFLQEPSRENVLQAVEAIRFRDVVRFVSLSYTLSWTGDV